MDVKIYRQKNLFNLNVEIIGVVGLVDSSALVEEILPFIEGFLEGNESSLSTAAALNCLTQLLQKQVTFIDMVKAFPVWFNINKSILYATK